MRTFVMIRKKIVVAEGVIFKQYNSLRQSKCVINWLGDTQSVVIWDSFDDAKKIHEHNGETEFIFNYDDSIKLT
jgi:hypothetical protein